MSKLIITILLSICSLHVAAQFPADPHITLGNIGHAPGASNKEPIPASVATILANPKLVADREAYRVLTFEVTIAIGGKGGDLTTPVKIVGNELSAEIKDILQNKVTKGILYIDGILVQGPDRTVRAARSIIISFSR